MKPSIQVAISFESMKSKQILKTLNGSVVGLPLLQNSECSFLQILKIDNTSLQSMNISASKLARLYTKNG